jgi:hypothetical protein
MRFALYWAHAGLDARQNIADQTNTVVARLCMIYLAPGSYGNTLAGLERWQPAG